MAYTKSLELNNGFTVSYWRITKIDANKTAKNVEVIVAGYKDKATRDADGRPVSSKIFLVPITSLDLNGNLFEQAYDAIKELKEQKDVFNPNATPFFSDAVEA